MKKLGLLLLTIFSLVFVASCSGVKTKTKTLPVETTTDPTPTTGEHEHDYHYDHFKWEETTEEGQPKYTAYVVFVCSEDETHTKEIEIVITETARTQATCQAYGSVTYSVEYDGHTETHTFEGKTYGDHTPEVLPAVAPTCTEKGKTEGSKCSVCGEILTAQQEIDALGHDPVHHDAKAATCTEAGHNAYDTCSRCDYTTYEELPATGHKYGEATYQWIKDSCTATRVCENNPKHVETETVKGTYVKDTDATCEDNEKGHYTVAFENEAFAAQQTAANTTEVENTKLNHDYTFSSFKWAEDNKSAVAVLVCSRDNSHVKEVAATMSSKQKSAQSCTTAEVWTYTATYGEQTDSKDVTTKEATGHDYETTPAIVWDNENKANLVYKCSHECGVDKVVALTVNHEAKSATCTEQGKDVYTAVLPDGVTEYTGNLTKTIVGDDALGHDLGDWNQDKAPSCTEAGSKTRSCSRCEYQEKEAIAALGHNYQEVENTKVDPTCTAPGHVDKKCANCNDTYTDEIPATGHKLTHHDAQAVTCTEAGWAEYDTCDNCDYTTKVLIPATGHSFGEWTPYTPAGCTSTGTERRYCANCEHYEERTVSALGHDYKVTHKDATCTEAGSDTYTCSRCDDSYTNTIPATGHNYGSNEEFELLQKGETCKYDVYKHCETCGKDILQGTVDRHNLKTRVNKEATCSAEGEKETYCTNDGCTYSVKETIAVNPLGHSWVLGNEIVDGKRTDTCSICSETKTVVVGGSNIAASTEEVALGGNTSVQLDAATAEQLKDNTISVSVTEIDKDENEVYKNLSDEQKAQVGDSKVYDFSMVDENSQAISNFTGKVTVTLPYQLEEGEDISSIAVWFIDDEGKLTAISATYCNGYVSFETDHFSYYTVTKLTPAERCAKYGHNYVLKQHKDATCTEDGYDLMFCIRCHAEEKQNVVEHQGHDYQYETVAATCGVAGYKVTTCSHCDYTSREILPALEHNYEVKDSKAATCTEAGYNKYECANCHHEYTETIEALGHNYEVVEEVPATCTTIGYKTYKCSRCEDTYNGDYVDALGHDYKATVTWGEDHLSAQFTLVCENNHEHTVTLVGVVNVINNQATCAQAGNITYQAILVYGEQEYKEEYVEESVKLPHTLSKELQHDDEHHYFECSVCGEHIEEDVHNFSEEITTPYDCGHDGVATYTCAVCGYVVEKKIPATGNHNYLEEKVEPTCAQEGLSTFTCTVCGHSYTEKIPATGEHTEVVERVEPTCAQEGSIITKCSVCGKVLKTETIKKLSHTEAEQITPPTCAENGVKTTVCSVCGEVLKTEIIAATGEHTFVDGVCTVCGYVDGSCDHDDLHEVIIDFAELGCCGGQFKYYTCNCGQNVVVSVEDFEAFTMTSPCQFQFDMPEQGKHIYEKALCRECGLEVIMDCDIVHNKETGNDLYKMQLTFTRAGKDIFDAYVEIDYEHHHMLTHDSKNYEKVYVEGACDDGYLLYEKCQICDELVYVSDSFKCAFEYKNEQSEDGSISREIRECKKCGLKLVRETKYTPVDTCTKQVEYTLYLYMNGKLVDKSLVGSYLSESHETEELYELFDEKLGCEGGYKVTRRCKKCGEIIDEYEGSGHQYSSVEFSRKDERGYMNIKYEKCDICEHIGDVRFGASKGFFANDYEVLENGFDYKGVHYEFGNRNYTEDGSFELYWVWNAIENGCEQYDVNAIIIYENDELVFELIGFINGEESNHNYEVKLVFDEETQAYNYYRVCQKCGDKQLADIQSTSQSVETADGTLYVDFDYFYGPSGNMIYTDVEVFGAFEYNDEEYTKDVDGKTYEGYRFYSENVSWYVVDCFVEQKGCYKLYDRIVSVTMNGQEMPIKYQYFEEEHHYEARNIVYANEELGCIGGVSYDLVCTVCGNTKHIEHNGHYAIDEYEVAQVEGLCGELRLYHCIACGELYDIDAVDCELTPQGKVDGVYTYQCKECGLKVLVYYEYLESGCTKYTILVNEYVLGEEKLATARHYYNKEENHHIDRYYVTYLNNKDCSAGVYAFFRCSECGLEYGRYNSGHEYEQEEIEYTFGEDGKLVLILYKCIFCDLESHFDIDEEKTNIEFEMGQEARTDDDGNKYQSEILTNETYGIKLVRTMITYNLGDCYYQNEISYQMFVNDELVRELRHLEEKFRSHNYVDQVTLNDEEKGLEGGYTARRVCSGCGEVISEYKVNSDYATFNNHMVGEAKMPYILVSELEDENLAKMYQAQGIMYVYYYDVTVGLESTYWTTDFEMGDNRYTIDGSYWFNLTRFVDGDELYLYKTNLTPDTLANNGEIIISGAGKYRIYCGCRLGHNNEACVAAKLIEKMEQGSEVMPMERAHVYKEQAVETPCGVIYVQICEDCGKAGYINLDSAGHVYDYKDLSYTDDDGNRHSCYEQVCQKCGATIHRDSYQIIDGCNVTSYNTTRLSYGEYAYSDTNRERYERHTFENETFEPIGTDCEKDGYYRIATCTACGKEIRDKKYGHYFKEQVIVDFQELDGCCGGRVSKAVCAICGKEDKGRIEIDDYHNWYTTSYNKEVELDGILYNVNVMVCEKCNLRQETWTREVPLEDCRYEVISTRYYYYNDELVYEYVDIYTTTKHEYEVSYEFLGEERDCEQGVRYVYTCKNCGDSYEDECYDHYTRLTQTIDLAEYGCVCGGYLEIETCPCGKEKWTKVETNCDFDYDWYHLDKDEVAEGILYEDIDEYTCAVTDPECGFCYREIHRYYYHDENSCMLDYDLIYQFGYNKETGEFAYEIIAEHREETSAQHRQIEHIYEENYEKHYCTVCGAYSESKRYYDDEDFMYKSENTYYKWNNNDISYNSQECAKIIIGEREYQYYTRYETRHQYADGSEFWRIETYNRNEEDPCWLEYTSIDSYGNNNKDNRYDHLSYNSISYLSPTCTQPGGFGEYCYACGKSIGDGIKQPLGHDYYYDSEKGIYVCSRCGLENLNGADGEVILEDFSSRYEYRVGFYNQGMVEFTKYICLVVMGEDGEEQEIIIPSLITFNYNDSIYCFYRSDVEAYAKENNITNYKVRFVLVPKGVEGDFDYAITFNKTYKQDLLKLRYTHEPQEEINYEQLAYEDLEAIFENRVNSYALPNTGSINETEFRNWKVVRGDEVASISADNVLTLKPTIEGTYVLISVTAIVDGKEYELSKELYVAVEKLEVAKFLESDGERYALEVLVLAYNPTNGNAIFADLSGMIFAYNCGIKDATKVQVGHMYLITAKLEFNNNNPQLANMEISADEGLLDSAAIEDIMGNPSEFNMDFIQSELSSENPPIDLFKGEYMVIRGYAGLNGKYANLYASVDENNNGIVGNGFVTVYAASDLRFAEYAGKEVLIYAFYRNVNLDKKELQVQLIKVELANEEDAAKTIAVDKEELTVGVGGETIIKIAVNPWAGKYFTYSYESKNMEVAIATLNEDGTITVTGVAAGETTITVMPSKGNEVYISVKVEAGAPTVTTYEMKYSGSTANMSKDDASKNAKLVNLDTNMFEVYSILNDSSTHVGLNQAGNIRLYNKVSTTNGESMKVALTDAATKNGYKITSVKITLASSNPSGYAFEVLAGSTVVEAVDGVYTINGTEFSIHNIAEANVQLHIASVEILVEK